MSRFIRFTDAAWTDYVYRQGQDKKTLKRINTLIEAARRGVIRLLVLASPNPCWEA